MTREFVTLPSFDVKWKDLELNEDDNLDWSRNSSSILKLAL